MDRRRVLISPSVMCADPLDLKAGLDPLVANGVDLLHLDIMDGHYVPNFTLGPDLCRHLGNSYALPLDVHLMVDEPEKWVPQFARMVAESRGGGAGYVTFHPEVDNHPARTLQLVRDAGSLSGIAVDPAWEVSRFRNLLELSDQVLIMCVNPGYAGQKLLPWTLESITEAARLREQMGLNYRIEVDGNVSWQNIPGMVDAGADILVTGTSSLFDPDLSPADAMTRLRQLI